MMKIIGVIVLLLVSVSYVSSGVCPWYESDGKAWSNPSTWPSGKVPVAGDDVLVPASTKVRYDVTTPTMFKSITLDNSSQLVFDGSKQLITMDTNSLMVKDKAALRVGGVDCLYTNKAVITLYGPRDTVTNVAPFMGNKGIISAGTIAFYGYHPQNTWTRITATVPVGATSFTVLDDITGWNVGDRCVITTTDYYEWMNEEFFIKAINGRTITMDRAVKYLHWGANDEFAEVALLSRNIVVQGDNSSDASLYGGHTIVYGNGTGKVQGVEFTRMGQANVLARYPMHYHFQGDQANSGSFVKGCSFRNNYQRCMTIHGTSGIRADRNVGFNVTGHCFFLEEGSETNNTITNNLGIYPKPGTMIPSDNHASVFWITNPNNTVTGNVAVGGFNGFWISLPYQPLGMSAAKYAYMYPRNTPLGIFENNTAHSNIQNGVHVDECPNADGTIQLQCDYIAYKNPADPNSGNVRNTFNGNMAWKNRQYGTWIRGTYLTVNNAYLIDNGIGVNIPTTANLVTNTVIVGETPNAGMTWMTNGWDDKGRSRPKLWNYDFRIHGLEVYDSAGNQFARNVTIKNFFSDNVRLAGAIGAVAHGYYILPPNNILTQINIPDGSNVWMMEPNTGYYDGPKHLVLTDADGSWTGDYGGTLIGNSPLLSYNSNCTMMPNWDGFGKCQRNADGYSQMAIINTNTGGTDYGSSSTMVYRATVTPLGRPDVATPIKGIDPRNEPRFQYSANVYSRKAYLMTFPHPTPPNLQVNMRYASSGEWVVAVFSYPNTASFTVTRGYYKNPLTRGNSVDDLSASTYYYDAVNQFLYVMYVEDNGGLEGTTGFPQYQWGSQYVDITASCGKTCTVSTSQQVPPALVDREDKYRATLQGCTAGTTNSYQGTAYVSFNSKTKQATFVIYHNIPGATSATLVGARSGTIITYAVPQAPIRGVVSLSYNKWNELWAGDWSITIQNNDPNSVIKGRLGCSSGACTAPPPTSSRNPCTATAPYEMAIYSDGLNSKDGWIDWSWSVARNFSYSGDTRCGTTAVSAIYQPWGSLSLHLNGACAPGACTDLSWQKPYVNISNYRYLEMYVKSPAGPMPFALTVQAQDSTDKVIGSVQVATKHIDTYYIDNSWCRVRIPFTDMGLKGNELMGTFGIQMNGALNPTWTLLFDHIKLISDYAESFTVPPYGAGRLWSTSC